MIKFLKKLLDWIFGRTPKPSPSPTRPPNPSPTPSPINQPVTVMVTNTNGDHNIMLVTINGVNVEELSYPIVPGQQGVGITSIKEDSATIIIYFNDISIHEHVKIGLGCTNTGATDMCLVNGINTRYGVTIYYGNGSC